MAEAPLRRVVRQQAQRQRDRSRGVADLGGTRATMRLLGFRSRCAARSTFRRYAGAARGDDSGCGPLVPSARHALICLLCHPVTPHSVTLFLRWFNRDNESLGLKLLLVQLGAFLV